MNRYLKQEIKVAHSTNIYAVQSSRMYRFLLAPNANLCKVKEKEALSSKQEWNARLCYGNCPCCKQMRTWAWVKRSDNACKLTM